MTLILSCLTNDCVYQVSDRRLTSFDPPRAPIDDECNKAVVVNGRVAFGYTGISKINGERTDLWLSRTSASVATKDLGEICTHIKNQATADFKKMRFATIYKRHAFQAVGWFLFDEEPRIRAGVVTIENAINSETNDWLDHARSSFDLGFRTPKLNRAQFYLTSVGLRPTTAERSAVYKLIQKCVHRRVRRHELILHAMIISMRWLHQIREPNSPIGANLMAVAIPRIAVEKAMSTGESMLLCSGPINEVATFIEVHANGNTSRVGPNFVHEGIMISNFEVNPIR